jgi:hypothetical protein
MKESLHLEMAGLAQVVSSPTNIVAGILWTTHQQPFHTAIVF